MRFVRSVRRRARLGVVFALSWLVVVGVMAVAATTAAAQQTADVEDPVEATISVVEPLHAGHHASFQGTSVANGWYWWNFGDGSTSTEQAPEHTFDEAGTYRVSFAVCASLTNCAATSRLVLVNEINTEQDVEIAYAPLPPSAGEEIRFISRVSSTNFARPSFADWSFRWTFGDGQTGSGPYPTHRYAAAGDYVVTLEICSPTRSECLSFTSTTVSVSAVPVERPGQIVVNVLPETPRIGDWITATVSSPDVTILGSFFLYEASAMASWPGNPSAFATILTRPTDQLIVAACYVAPELYCQLIEQTVTLEQPAGGGTGDNPAAPTDLKAFWLGEGTRLEWTDTNDLEDGYVVRSGATSDSLNLVVRYPRDTQAILVTDGSRCFEVSAVYGGTTGPMAATCRVEDRQSTPLAVTNPNWVAYPTEPRAGEIVTFMAREPGDADPGFGQNLSWDFGDGSALVGAHLVRTHTYADPGTYAVTLGGCTGDCQTATRTITVRPAEAEPYDNGLMAPTGLSYVGWQGHPTGLRWTDTNTDEHRYEVYTSTQPTYYEAAYGLRRSLPANATRVVFSDHPYADYDLMCYEVRAMRGYEVGPAATVCDGRAFAEILEMTATVSPGQVGATLTITAVVDSVGHFWVGSADPADGFPACLSSEIVDRDAFTYELADAEGRQVRHYTINLPDAAIGHDVEVSMRGINANESPCGGQTITVAGSIEGLP